MMRDIRPQSPVQTSYGRDSGRYFQGIDRAAVPVQRMQDKIFALNLSPAIDDACSDMHFVPGLFGGARHGQPMREKVPVFGNEIEQLARHQRAYAGNMQAGWLSCGRSKYRN